MRSLFGAVAGILLAAAAFAQNDRTITGTVADSSDAAIPKAKVLVTDAETGVRHETLSTPTGNYTIASLPVGTYNLIVAVTGFKTFIQSGIEVAVAQTARVDVTLQVGLLSRNHLQGHGGWTRQRGAFGAGPSNQTFRFLLSGGSARVGGIPKHF